MDIVVAISLRLGMSVGKLIYVISRLLPASPCVAFRWVLFGCNWSNPDLGLTACVTLSNQTNRKSKRCIWNV